MLYPPLLIKKIGVLQDAVKGMEGELRRCQPGKFNVLLPIFSLNSYSRIRIAECARYLTAFLFFNNIRILPYVPAHRYDNLDYGLVDQRPILKYALALCAALDSLYYR